MSLSSRLLEALRLAVASEITETSADGSIRTMVYRELAEHVETCVHGLTKAGVRAGHTVSIQSANTIDFVIWDLACMAVGATSLVFPEAYPQEERLARLKRFDVALHVTDQPGSAEGQCIEVGLDEWSWRDTKALMRDHITLGIGQRPLSRVFSSGTTGTLKGLDIAETGVEFVIDSFISAYGLTADDSHIIFLPISNFQQRLSIYGCIRAGASLHLCPYQKVFEVARRTQPTFLIGPPAFYKVALATRKASGVEVFGRRLRFLITGMSAVPPSIFEAFDAMGVRLYDAYGLTETGMVAWNTPASNRRGTVGRPLRADHVRIADDGEIMVSRPTPLASGYFESSEEDRRSTFRVDGIATGDLGHLDDDGFLVLRGRKKDIIVLANGKKINPQEMESDLQVATGLSNILVLGDEQLGIAVVVHADPAYADDAVAQGVHRRIVEASQNFERDRWVSKVVALPIDVLADSRFLTRNMKINRKALKTLIEQ